MQFTFNLVDQPLVPCLRLNGEQCELGLEDVLAQAHELREIAADSPLVTVSLHRLLLAILHHNFGPDSMEAWADLWQEGHGRWDSQVLHSYLHATVRYTRFDLFAKDRPFFQHAGLPFTNADDTKSYLTNVAKLSASLAVGNNDTLFDHSTDDRPPHFTPSEVARLLVASQSFSPGGLVTFKQGQPRGKYGSADHSLLVKGAVCLVRGSNLFQTLMLNFHLYSAEDEEPFSFRVSDDLPSWDRETPLVPDDRYPTGYLDLLTWQSRRIRLHPEAQTDGSTVVRSAVIMKGEQFPDDCHRFNIETMVAFTKNDSPKAKEPWKAVDFDEGRELWRDSLAILQSLADSRRRPRTLTWLSDLCREGIIPPSTMYQVDAAGICTSRAKILFWRHERLPLPLAYLDDEDLVSLLGAALHLAERVAAALRLSCWHYCRILLLQDESKDPGREAKKDIQRLLDTMSPERRYWPDLEARFLELMRDLPRESMQDKVRLQSERETRLIEWDTAVYRVAKTAFDALVLREDRSARSLRAASIAQQIFFRQLTNILPERDITHVTSE